MEVLARRGGSFMAYAVISFIMTAIGFVVCIAGCILSAAFLPPKIWAVWLMFLTFPAIFIPNGIFCLKKAMLPENLIFLENGNIRIYDGTIFALREISDVSYKAASSKYGTLSYGRIVFSLRNGDVVKVYPVAELEKTGSRLSRLVYGQQGS